MKPALAKLLLVNDASALRRLAAIVVGVAVGTGMLLILLGAFLGMPEREARVAWVTSGGEYLESADDGTLLAPAPTDSTMLLSSVTDHVDGKAFTAVSVSAPSTTQISLPSGQPMPGPGEYYASPAMAQLISKFPANQLADRYGSAVGEIAPQLLKGADQRVIVAGATWSGLSQLPSTTLQTEFRTAAPQGASATFQTIIAIGSVALLVPIVLFISIISQLGAAQRRERFSTVRLIGAGRRAMASLSGLEMFAASMLGALGGIGVAALIRPAATQLGINGATTYAADLTPGLGATLASVVVVALIATFTAWWRTYRDDVGALGASRERAEKPVRWTRALVLFVGLGILGGSALMSGDSDIMLLGVVLGFALTAFGVVVAGPWITRVSSNIFSAVGTSAPAMVAAGRLARHPRATFRSVAGLVVAVFVVSVFAGVAGAISVAAEPTDSPGYLAGSSLVAELRQDSDPQALAASMQALDGVQGVALAWQGDDVFDPEVMTAADAIAIGALGVPDSPAVSLSIFDMQVGDWAGLAGVPTVEPAPPIDDLVPAYVVVLTDGSQRTIDTVRTALIGSEQTARPPVTRADQISGAAADITNELAKMAYIGMALAIGISALSLTVATISAALDRKRMFGLMRLAGMPVRLLRKTISFEAAVPLGATLVASAGLGFVVAAATLHGLDADFGVVWPDARYWVAVGGSVAIAVVAIASSFSTVRRSTEFASTRFE